MSAKKLINRNGDPVPSISQVLAKFKDPGGLLFWAWKVGKEGKTLDEARREKSSIGHLCASLALEFIGGPSVDRSAIDRDMMILTQRPLALWHERVQETDLDGVVIDQPMVSESHGFGGLVSTVQAGGLHVVLSLKAGKGIYTEDVLTAAAQAHLAGTDHALLVRFNKDNGGLDEFRFLNAAELAAGWALFQTFLTAFGQVKPVEQIALKGAA